MLCINRVGHLQILALLLKSFRSYEHLTDSENSEIIVLYIKKLPVQSPKAYVYFLLMVFKGLTLHAG